MHLTIKIWCDGSVRRTKIINTNKCPRAAFAAWHSDTGHYWYDQIYARTSSEAELSAIMVALFWASQQDSENIKIYTDDQSIPNHLYGPNQGKALGDIKALIESCSQVQILHIPRGQNGQAHRLCSLAHQEYLKDPKFPRKIKRKWSYRSLSALREAHSQGYIREVQVMSDGTPTNNKVF